MYGLKRMSSPVTAPSGIFVAGIGMLVAVLASFLYVFSVDAAAKPHLLVNIGLAVAALSIGGGAAWWGGKKVAMTAMPQMVAIYNGMGGGAAGAIAAVELFGNKTARRNPAGRDAGGRPDRRGIAVRLADRLGQARWRHQEALAGQGPAGLQRRWSCWRRSPSAGTSSSSAQSGASPLIAMPSLIYLFFGLRAGLRHSDDACRSAGRTCRS